MCGIVATLLYPQEREKKDWIAIRDSFTQNLVFNEERGAAATGLAVVQSDGEVRVYKAAVKASEFVQTCQYQQLLAEADSHTTLILGHTRLPTKGDPAYNGNNHPLQAGPIFGVHNGIIDNDDALFDLLCLPRDAQVDSEIIFRFLERIAPTNTGVEYLKAVRSQLQQIQGQFTFLACDQRRPEILLVLRHGNPISTHFHEAWNALIFSSSYVFLRKFFGSSPDIDIVEQDQLMLFDAPALPRLGSRSFASVSFC